MRFAAVSTLLGALALAAGSVGGVALAADAASVTHARLEVQALPDCATRDELVARVAARSHRIQFDNGATGPALHVVVAHAPHAGAVAELEISETGGKTWSRRLSAPSCAEATDALALIIALTLDPTVRSDHAALPAAPAPTPPRTTAGTARAPAPTPPPTLAGARKPSSSAAVPAAGPAATDPATPIPAAVARTGAGAAAELLVGLAPGALPGFGVSVMAARDREAAWSPALVLGGTHAWSSGFVERGGTAAFTVDALTLDACPVRARLRAFEARACVTALVGRVRADGADTYAPASASRPYAAAGGAMLLSLGVGRFIDLTARISGGASLIQDSFSFSPTVFYRTAATILQAGLGIELRIP